MLINYAYDDAAAEAAVRVLEQSGGKAWPVRAEVGDAEEVRGLFDETERRYGGLDVFVHNAVSFHPMPTAPPNVELSTLDNAVALGPLLHGAERLGELLGAGRGRIIAISSRGARSTIPGYLSLGMAKAALENLVRYLAVEFAGRGITVNAVAPGRLAKKSGPAEAEIIARVTARTPAGRLTTAEDVADIVALLCRDEAAWLHGQVIAVDGGIGLMS